MRSQIARIRQTIAKVLDSDTTLGEKIRTIFREQGITIVAVLTAFSLIIATIVQAVTGAATNVTTGGTAGKAKDWLQKQLKNLADLIGKLGEKLANALPGILGSIVSWLFSLLKKATLFVAEYVWVFIVFIAGLLISYLWKKRD